MALTATATLTLQHKITELLLEPTSSIASVNRPNITLSVMQLKPWQKSSRYTSIAEQIHLLIAQKKAIVYLDLTKDVGPITIALQQLGIHSCSYHGQNMSPHDKSSAMENWRDGVIEAMVCTSAFGMGINQSDVDIVVRVGCPPSIESWSQELGRCGRDGRPASGTHVLGICLYTLQITCTVAYHVYK